MQSRTWGCKTKDTSFVCLRSVMFVYFVPCADVACDRCIVASRSVRCARCTRQCLPVAWDQIEPVCAAYVACDRCVASRSVRCAHRTRQCLPAPWDYLYWATLCRCTRTRLQCRVWYTFMKFVHIAPPDVGILWDVCSAPSVVVWLFWAVWYLAELCGDCVVAWSLFHVIRWCGISALYLRNV
jgi:hypothetical protein